MELQIPLWSGLVLAGLLFAIGRMVSIRNKKSVETKSQKNTSYFSRGNVSQRNEITETQKESGNNGLILGASLQIISIVIAVVSLYAMT